MAIVVGNLYRYKRQQQTAVWNFNHKFGDQLMFLKPGDHFVALEVYVDNTPPNSAQPIYAIKALFTDGQMGKFACYSEDLELAE